MNGPPQERGSATRIKTAFLNMRVVVYEAFGCLMRHQAPAALFIVLLAVSLFSCAVLFSTFLSTSAASNGYSSFASFAPGDGEAALWRKLSSFDRVAFVVIDALRSARVQVRFSLLAS